MAKKEVPEYQIGFGDVLEIKFFNKEKFNEIVSVRPDGRITLQRIGDIEVNGMTPSALNELITESYSKIIISPDVTVFVREFGGNQIFVLGEVNEPGGFPIQQNMNLIQAIAIAGGAKDGAKLSSVIVLRKKTSGEVEAKKVNLSATVKGQENSGQIDLAIQPQDIVFVPKTFIANVGTFMKQVYDGFLPPLESYMRFLYWTR
jgi:polysaccharide biosynthesis/export protein